MNTQTVSSEITSPVDFPEAGARARCAPIRVYGFDPGRVEFSEDTHTLAVGPHSARIALRNSVVMDDVLRIVNLEDYTEADFRIVGPTRLSTSGPSDWVVDCLDMKRNIWNISLASEVSLEADQVGPLLECRACGKRQCWPASTSHNEVLRAFGIVVYECSTCGRPTYWALADASQRPSGFPPVKDVAPPARVFKTRGFINTRAHKRLALKMPLLVRTEDAHEELSTTENLSVAGFAAVLGMELQTSQRVTVICPYLAGGQNIEQKAECRWGASVTPGGVRKIYGFRYLP